MIKHETCVDYALRRIREGWEIEYLKGIDLVLVSPAGFKKYIDLRHDVETLYPNVQGVYTDFTKVGSASTKWESVKDTDDGNYVTSSSNSDDESYGMDATGIGDSDTINSVTMYYRTARVNSSNQKYYTGIISGGTSYNTTYRNFSSDAWRDLTEVYNTDPNGGGAWTKTRINGMEIYIENYSSTGGCKWATAYAEVDYTPAGGWTNIAKVNGVTATDFAKVRGIAVGDIAKRRGIAV